MIKFKQFNESINIQAQDPRGNSWRTYDTSTDNEQQILYKMKKLQKAKKDYRIRAVDSKGKLVDMLTGSKDD